MPGIDRFGKTLVVNCTMGNGRKEGGALIEITPETVTGPALVTRLWLDDVVGFFEAQYLLEDRTEAALSIR